MNVTALWAGVLGALFGAMIYALGMVRRQRWRGVAVAAVGTSLLIDHITTDTISPTWRTIRFWVSCALVAVLFVAVVMDSRATRGSHSRTLGGGR